MEHHEKIQGIKHQTNKKLLYNFKTLNLTAMYLQYGGHSTEVRYVVLGKMIQSKILWEKFPMKNRFHAGSNLGLPARHTNLMFYH